MKASLKPKAAAKPLSKAAAAKPPAGKKPTLGVQVNIYEAKANLSKLVKRAAAGEEIILAKAGEPMARIVQLPPAPAPRRRFGGENFLRVTYMAPDWDAPMTEEELADWGM